MNAGAIPEMGAVARAPLTIESLLAECRTSLGIDDGGDADFGGDDFREPLTVLLDALDTEADLTLHGRWLTRRHLLAPAEGARPDGALSGGRPGRRRRADRDAAHRHERTAHRDDHPARPARRRSGAAGTARMGAAAARPAAGAGRRRGRAVAGRAGRARAAQLRRHRSGPGRHPRIRRAQPQGMHLGDVVRLPLRGIRRALRRPELHPLARAVRHASGLRLPPAGALAAAAPEPSSAMGAEVAGPSAFAEHRARRLSRRQGRRSPIAIRWRCSARSAASSPICAGHTAIASTCRPSAATTPSSTPARSTHSRRIPTRGLPSPAACIRASTPSSSADPSRRRRRATTSWQLPFTAAAQQKMQEYVAARPRGRHGSHEYSFAELGLDAAAERTRFAPYTNHFSVPDEVS